MFWPRVRFTSLGGGVINDFAFTFLIGIITGTYSTIYIASAFVLWWHKGERPNIGASQVTMQNAGGEGLILFLNPDPNRSLNSVLRIRSKMTIKIEEPETRESEQS